MDPSELRTLASKHAAGLLNETEYRQLRTALIDDIVSGHRRIVREPRTSLTPAVPARRSTTGRRLLLVAAAGAVVLLGVALLQRREAPAPTPASMPREVSAPRSTVTPARSLVETFLARRDFSAAALAAFEQAWNDLPGADHRLAREAQWFRSLAVTVQAQQRTQLALAELGGESAARERAGRLVRFAGTIGLRLPEAETADGDASARAATPDPAPRQRPEEWLQVQPPGNVTLQLFAVNALEHVGQLIDSYPRLDLHVLGSAKAPRYRVVLGSFDGVDAAKSAFQDLPAPVKEAAGEAIVKSIETLREDLIAVPAATLGPAPPRYALQLFATASEERARALLGRYPDLGLEVVAVRDSAVPHRVLMGHYADIDAARSARDALPGDLIEALGSPLIKRRDRLGDG